MVSIRQRWFGVMLVALDVTGGTAAVFSQTTPAAPRLENVDRRSLATVAPSKPQPLQVQAVERLRADQPRIAVDFDTLTGSPQFIRSIAEFLSAQPNVPATANPPATSAHAVTREYLNQHRELFQHDGTLLNSAHVRRAFVTPANGVQTVVWQQNLDGLPVCDALLLAHCTAAGELVSLSSQFIADPIPATKLGADERARLVAQPPLTLEEAVSRAARDLGDFVPVSEVRRLPKRDAGGNVSWQRLAAGFLPGDVNAQLTWLPISPKQLRLCWELILTSRLHREMFRVLVDAQNGEIWLRLSLTAYATPATYRVYTSDSPSPFSPGHAVPSTNQPPLVSRQLLVTNALNLTASPNGWINDGDNETRGNNVEAQTDRDGDNRPDLPRPHGSPARVFDFPLDLSQEPSAYGPASVVQLFYWCNWMHDQLYDLGFTEAAGNFQTDNFGRGGLDGDPVEADAQDASDSNNASMGTPPDGLPPQLETGLFSGSTPDRDAALDAEVVLHEYTHGLSNRRVGGGTGLFRLQSAGMGEGWSDFYSLAMLSQPGDDPDGTYPHGAYLTYQLSGLQENYYFGIRRYPYSTDLTKNPLTFKDIDPAQALAHDDVPRSPREGPFNPFAASEVHHQGEVWCNMLWEVRANLIRKLGFAAGNRLVLQLVTDGMNFSPPNPNFVQARDAILLADRFYSGGSNIKDIWAAFAKRGLGASAVSPASSTTTGVREAFDPPDNLTVRPLAEFTTTRRVGNGFVPSTMTFFLTNSESAAVSWTVHFEHSWLQVSPGSGTLPVGGPGQAVTVTLANAALSLPPGVHTSTLHFSNSLSHVVQPRTVSARVVSVDFLTESFEDNDNTLDFQSITFTPDDSPTSYQVCRTTVSTFPTDPAGGTILALGDDDARPVTLSGGAEVALFGSRTNVFFVGSNGYLTFGAGDSNFFPIPFFHFSRPRISALFADHDPGEGGQISWKQLSNLVAVTFLDVPSHSSDATNSYQVELFFDGRIRMTYLRLDSTEGLVGLSPGGGLSPLFEESHFSSYPSCSAQRLVLELPGTVLEGTSGVTGRVRVPNAPSTPLTINLSSSAPNELSVPAAVIIPAGQPSATFPVTLPEDNDLDGPQLVRLTATTAAAAYLEGSALLEVLDDERADVALSLPLETVEGAGAITGRVQLTRLPASSIVVRLSSSHSNDVQVPTSVLISAGATSQVFIAQVPEDMKLQGLRSVTVAATIAGWNTATASIHVADNESTNLLVSLPLQIRETDGLLPRAGQVHLGGTLAHELIVSLASSDSSELLLPASVTIPAGELAAAFALNAVDDQEVDGSQRVTVSAQAAGLGAGRGEVDVLDSETPRPPAYPSPAHLATNISVTADLSWSGGEYAELLSNGGFEEGTFRGWTVVGGVAGSFELNTATNRPPSGKEPLPPFEGNFSALAEQFGPGRHEMYQTFTVPLAPVQATLLWADQVRNSATTFGPDQEFRVELRTTNNHVLAVIHRTQPGDALFSDWTLRTFDLSPFAGQTVQVAFVVTPQLFFLEAHVDSVSVAARIPGNTRYDVYFGIAPPPTPLPKLGTTTNHSWSLPDLQPATTYYWQVVAQTLGQATGPIWQFSTRGVDHFVWEPIPSPQRTSQPFQVQLSARDSLNRTVTNFNVAVPLTALAEPREILLFSEDFEDGDFAGWERDAVYGDWAVVSNTAAGGRSSLSLVGGQGVHWDGLTHALPDLVPDIVKFSVQASRIDGGSTYVVLGASPERPQSAAFFFISWDGMGLLEDVNGGHRVPFQLRRWYEIALHFSWARRTIDYYVDGVLREAGVPFRGTNVSHLSQISLYNVSFAQSWWDDIQFIQTNQPVQRNVVPSSTGQFTNGTWIGSVTLTESSPRLQLQADDGSGHTGTSTPFAVVTANELALHMSQAPEPASLLGPMTFTTTVFNPGPSAMADALLTNRYPAGTVLVSFSSSQGQCEAANGEVHCQLGLLPAGAEVRFFTSVRATNYGRFTNFVEVTPVSAGNSGRYVATAVTLVAPPLLSVQDVIVKEGDTETTPAQFRLTLSNSNPLPVSVWFVTSNQTASAPSDYIPANGLLVFPPGTTQQTVNVLIRGDRERESSEVFTLHLRYALNASLVRSRAEGVIVDDDQTVAATLPFSEDWESGMRSFWLATGLGAFPTAPSQEAEPHNGSYHFLLDNPDGFGEPTRDELTLTIDLEGAANVVLRFWAIGSFLDADTVPPPTPFVGGADFDGVAVSADGVYFYEVQSLRSLPLDYTEFVVPLDAALASHGLSYTSKFRIRFNRVSLYYMPLSGMGLDDISLTSEPLALKPVQLLVNEENCLPANRAIDPGETVTVLLGLTNAGALPTHELTATLLPGGNVLVPTGMQNYGVLTPGGPAQSRPFTFGVGGACGGILRASFALADAGVPLGQIHVETPLGRTYSSTSNFSSLSSFVIATNGPASVYPSSNIVSGMTGAVQKVTVTLHDFSHRLPDQVDVLLRGPDGKTVTLLSDAGGFLAVSNVTLVFDSTVTNRLPDNEQIIAGTYSPTNYGSTTDGYPLPAPNPPYGTSLDIFKGTNPNGLWQLFVYDDTLQDGGSLGGWTLQVDSGGHDCCDSGPTADLTVGTVVAPSTVSIDRNLSFVSTVLNRGPATATDLVLSNQVPAGAVVVTATSSVGSCVVEAGMVRCQLGSLASNSSANVTLTVQAIEPGLLTSVITVTGNERDPLLNNNTATANGVVTLPLLSLQNAPAPVSESATAATLVQFLLTLGQGSTRTASVYFATADETAIAGVDYQPTNGLVAFLPGETSKSIAVRVLDDLIDESPETFSLNLFNPVNCTVSSAQGIGTVNDNDPVPALSISDVFVNEGDSGFTDAQFRVRLLPRSGQAVQVGFSTGNGTAVAPLDYLSTNGTLLMFAGETNRLLSIRVRGDRLNELTEFFTVFLASPFNAVLSDNQGRATITDDDLLPTIAVEAGSILQETCLPANQLLDPGETVTHQFIFRNLATASARASNLVATLQANDRLLTPRSPPSLGAISAGGTVAGDFTFTIGGQCGQTIQATFLLQDGERELGSVTVPLTSGRQILTFAEDFDGVLAPALPPGWTAQRAGTSPPWRTTTTSYDTPPNAVMAPDPGNTSTNDLISPPIAVGTFQTELMFRHSFNTESNWDGGILEVSLDGGSFVDFVAAGGHFMEGAYNGMLRFFQPGWTGNSGGFVTVRGSLPLGAIGTTAQFRWRCTSDSVTAGVGWFVDSISFADGMSCCGSAQPLLITIGFQGDQVMLQWSSLPTRTYQVQYKNGLEQSQWFVLPGDVIASGPLATKLDPLPAAQQRFYRVVLLE
jgi:uncharacterized repeat protein (TIGR01451 family)